MATVPFDPPSPDERNRKRLDHALGMFNIVRDAGNYSVDPDPQYDYLKKAEEYANRAAQIRAQAATNRANSFNVNYSGGGGGGNVGGNYPDNQFGAFIRAIAGKESGGNYGAVNADSGAMGKYQIMPSNITGVRSGWDWDALGRDVSTQQFLNSPKLQERIARARLRQYYSQYGPAGAASAWYSGSADNWNSKASQGKYPSIHAYVMDILRRMGLA